MLHKYTGSPEINMSTFLYFAQLNAGCSSFFYPAKWFIFRYFTSEPNPGRKGGGPEETRL